MLRVITVRSTGLLWAASARTVGARMRVSVSAQASARRVHEVMAPQPNCDVKVSLALVRLVALADGPLEAGLGRPPRELVALRGVARDPVEEDAERLRGLQPLREQCL